MEINFYSTSGDVSCGKERVKWCWSVCACVWVSLIYTSKEAQSQAWQQACGSMSPTSSLNTLTHTPQCLTAAPRLSAGSSGYSRPAGQTLWKPLSHTHSPPPQGSGGDIRLPVQRRPGLALGAACDLVCVCVLSPSLWGYRHTTLLSPPGM